MGDKITWVKVVDADGNVQKDEVPSHWVGTDLLPHGYKKAGRAAGGQSSSNDNPPADPNPVPAKSTSRPDLEAYAVEHGGMTEEEAKAYPIVDELHAALVAA